jgi:sugar phosphate permease
MSRVGEQPLLDEDEDNELDPNWSSVSAHRWCGTIVAILFFLFDIFCRLVPNVLATTLQKEYNLGASEVSSAFGSSVFFAYAACQLPHGVLLDVVGPRRLIAVCAAIAGIGHLMFALSKSVEFAVIGRVLSGAAIGAGWLGCYKVMTLNFVNDKHKATMVSTALTTGILGGMICQSPFLALVNAAGWRKALVISAIIPLIVMVGAILFVSDTPARRPKQLEKRADQAVTTFSEECGKTYRTLRVLVTSYKPWVYGFIFGGLDVPFENLAGLWGATFLEQSQGFSKTNAAHVCSILVLASAAAMMLSGWIMQRVLGYNRRIEVALFCATVGVVGMVPMVLQEQLPNGTMILSFLLQGFGQTAVGFCWVVLIRDHLHLGVATGFMNTIGIAMDAVGESVVGMLMDVEWDGTKRADGTAIYSKRDFGLAFLYLLAGQGLACILLLLLRCSEKGVATGDGDQHSTEETPAPPPTRVRLKEGEGRGHARECAGHAAAD